jgi:hypothetical protein
LLVCFVCAAEKKKKKEKRHFITWQDQVLS